ncbi:uncharacterized protein J4E79_003912 [Alternaria viburni]|uniref:uncharacterized protein n=1 Tax=Alternaria viburni TaxID=566460 RepID=UPI0020C213D0|nr:uncharacterized protein J4E79_003912 [Alternaria viburni]KAI4664408.1 hypothetical protein J4E79_003912 [Alternaria viburni]
MRAFLLRKWQRKKPEPTTAISIKRSQDAKSMPRAELPRDEPLDQKQCMLFGKLSPELRLLIYEEVLADPQRLLHFLHVTPGKGRPHKLGHWRCEDMDTTLDELRLLRIEMTIWAQFAFHDVKAGTPEPESLIFIFEALKQVHAEVYEVGLNVDLPEQVVDALGNIPFRISRLKKQYDRKTFPL